MLYHFYYMCAREPEAELDPAVAPAMLDRAPAREAGRGGQGGQHAR